MVLDMQVSEKGARIAYFFSGVSFFLCALVQDHRIPWPAYYHDLTAIVGLFLLAVGLFAGNRKFTPSMCTPAIGILIITLIPLYQISISRIFFAGDGLLVIAYLTALVIACILGRQLQLAHGERFTITLAGILLAAAVFSVILSLHQWLRLTHLGLWLTELRAGGRPYANLAQPNNLATLLCCGMAGALYLREQGHLGRLVLGFLALVLFSGVAMTRSRTALLVVLVMAVWALGGKRRLGLKLSHTEIIGGVLAFGVLWAGWPTLSDWLYLYATPTADRLGAVGGDVRLVLWKQLLDAAWREALFGYGWNQVSVAQVAVAAEYPQSVFVEHAHNIVIDLLIWNGVLIGGGIIMAAGWWLVTRMWRVESSEGWFGLTFILAVLTHAMFEFPLEYAYFLIPVGLCIGIVESRHPGGGSIGIPRWTLSVALCLGFAMLVWVFVEYQQIEADHRRMRFEAAGIEARPSKPGAPDVVLLTQQREFIRFARTQAREGMSDEELGWMRKVAHRYAFPPALFRYALALGLNNRPDEAALELRRLKQLHPPERFQEAKDGWLSLSAKYPQLSKVTGVF